jgi:transcriptional regulator GlxA family with amidase domain
MTVGGGGTPTRIVCGFLGGEEVRANPVLSTAPAVLHLDASRQSSAEWIRSTFLYAAREIAAGRAGTEVVMAKLSELLFVDAIRCYVEALPEDQTGWLAGLKDPFVARAMALLHARVSAPWTVDDLGRQVGLSRSALAERFTRIIGVPPMQYLANWRIHAAAHELLGSSKAMLQIAQEFGYDSEASFTRAFKRLMGAPPATWRRRRGMAAA